jgi:hypothetical protein
MCDQTVYVLCIRNENYPASLDLYKVYRAIPDDCAAQDQLLRVIDESGEHYLYPMNCFRRIKSPTTIKELEDIEDLAIAADFFERRKDASSPDEMGMLPWEDIANEWGQNKEPEE